jgi:serine/threonine protein kinase/beta-lactam-binding protein with PASTA domain
MVGRTFNGRYRITERIGIGGMAEVYRAQDNVLGRVVAVKVMLPQYAEDADFTRRFRQEASAAANLQSPYIVNVYDWGQDEGTYYIVMEYVRGSDLKTAINERGAISQRKVAQIGSQVCQALSVAHHLDIIHRDIKPQNIMIQPDGNIKVMDFGIARAKNAVKAQTSSVLGTAHYISPEQAQGKELTAASDMYSLGIVMYEAVTGHLPFDGPDAVSVAMKQVKEQPLPPSHWVPDIDPNLEHIIMKAMEKDPRKRFSTALEMRQVLTDYLAGRLGNRFSNARTQQLNTQSAPAGAYVPAGTTSVMPAVAAENGTSNGAKSKNYRNDSGKKKKMSGKKKALIAILILLLAAGIGYAIWAAVNASNTTIPDVSGQTLENAEQTLTDAGYSIGSTTEVYSTSVDKGKVVSTDPQAGQTAEKGTRVNITVSKGTEQVTVPNVVGKSETKAIAALSADGLTAKAGDSEYSDTVAKGHVISTDPSANTIVNKGSEVTYVLSLGPEQVDVPDVTGKSESEATSILQSAGFTVTTTEQSSSSVDEGDVISQSVTGQADKGSTINLVISTGSNEVPDVTGMTVSRARSVLQSAGYRVSVSGSGYSNSDTVSSYYPTTAEQGDTITLTVNTSTDNTSSSSSSSSTSKSKSSSSSSKYSNTGRVATRPGHASVAQGIEHRSPKAGVDGSNPPGGTR